MLEIYPQLRYYNKARLHEYALKREVAPKSLAVFPWSMFGLKPGGKCKSLLDLSEEVASAKPDRQIGQDAPRSG